MANRLQCSLTKSIERTLEPRLMHLLCYLAANEGRVLSRDELIKELWPKVIVNENSLTRAISELRKQLFNSTHPVQSPIETIPKKGYRLTCAVGVEQLQSALSVKLPLLASCSPWPKLAAAAVLALTVGVWFSQSLIELNPVLNSTLAENNQFRDELVGTETAWFGGDVSLSSTADASSAGPGTKSLSVYSNDASKLAYIQYDGSGSTIFIGNTNNLPNAVAIYGSADYLHNLSWSPVGNALLFARKKQMTTTALFSGESDAPELIVLDLDTMEASYLRKEKIEREENSGGTSLTSRPEQNTAHVTS